MKSRKVCDQCGGVGLTCKTCGKPNVEARCETDVERCHCFQFQAGLCEECDGLGTTADSEK